jgi:hypothetical protein
MSGVFQSSSVSEISNSCDPPKLHNKSLRGDMGAVRQPIKHDKSQENGRKDVLQIRDQTFEVLQ